MRCIIAGDHSFSYREVTAGVARELFAGQPYKLELVEGLAERGDTEDASMD
jgi:threonyl-tRNA synthetase